MAHKAVTAVLSRCLSCYGFSVKRAVALPGEEDYGGPQGIF